MLSRSFNSRDCNPVHEALEIASWSRGSNCGIRGGFHSGITMAKRVGKPNRQPCYRGAGTALASRSRAPTATRCSRSEQGCVEHGAARGFEPPRPCGHKLLRLSERHRRMQDTVCAHRPRPAYTYLYSHRIRTPSTPEYIVLSRPQVAPDLTWTGHAADRAEAVAFTVARRSRAQARRADD
jgi:hypothetical protein